MREFLRNLSFWFFYFILWDFACLSESEVEKPKTQVRNTN